ncbi:MAG: serine/threonine-protein kinase [Polyangiaceae bacterium]
MRDDPFVGTEYEAIERLGSGGMGVVYSVLHRRLRQKHAAKILHPELAKDARIVDRMRLEAQALCRLHHENIVEVRSFERTKDGLPFIVMELLEGHSLRDELAIRNRLPVTNALVHAIDIANALSAVHSLGIVHRDIKPANLFLHYRPDQPVVVKMLDFGAARVLPGVSPDAPEPLIFPTRTGTVVGTPPFMSPEAAAGEPIDARSDIYSAGCVLYRMLAGRGPYDHIEDTEQLLEALVAGTCAPPSTYLPRPLPLVVDALVMHALSRDPNTRFQSASEFAKSLVEITVTLIEAQRAGNLDLDLSQPVTGVARTRRPQEAEPQVPVEEPTRAAPLAAAAQSQPPPPVVQQSSRNSSRVSAHPEPERPGLARERALDTSMSDRTWKVLVFLAFFFGTIFVVVTASRWVR